MFFHPPLPARNRLLVAAVCLIFPLTAARADEPALRELLRDGLYAEEVTRDPAAAAKHYEQVLARYAEQRDFAASALFRLAEVRRKQDRKEDAVKLYQQLLTEFPGAANETKLARENLAALGGKMPEAGVTAVVDEEEKEIQRLETLLKTSPDLVRNGKDLDTAIDRGWIRVAEWLVKVAKADPANPELLMVASTAGNLDMVRWLLSARGKSSGGELTEALLVATQDGYLEVVRELLKAGAEPNSSQDGGGGRSKLRAISLGFSRPLTAAISSAQFKVADVLLDAGADVNAVDGKGGTTPLFAAAANPDPAAARCLKRLIELGAKTDVTAKVLDLRSSPARELELNPIQAAVLNEAWDNAKILIANGADLRRAGMLDPFLGRALDMDKEKLRFLIENGADPKQPRLLRQLIDSGPDAIPVIQLLLEAGCDPNEPDSSKVPPIVRVFDWNLGSPGSVSGSDKHRKQVELIQLLLKHGADPNTTYGEFSRGPTIIRQTRVPSGSASLRISPFVEDSEESKDYPASLLMKVVELEKRQRIHDTSLIKILLDAGAKPTVEFPEVFDFVAQGYKSLPIAKTLLPFRPKTLNLDRMGYFPNWDPQVKRLFLDEVFNPALAAKVGIHFVLAEQGGSKTLLAEGQSIPVTAELLLNGLPSVLTSDPFSKFGYAMDYSGKMREPVLTLVRRSTDGTWTREEIDWKGNGPLPKLQAGDIIEVAWGAVFSKDSGNNSAFADYLTWHFRKRISFPVIVEIDGKAREILVRGDRVIFDPTKDEVPLCDAQKLMEWLWPHHPTFSDTYPSTILATRKGWPEVRLAYGSKEAGKFQLQAGDRVKLEIPDQARDELAKRRRSTVALQVPGLPFRREFGRTENSVILTVTMPSLVQAIVDAQVPDLEFWKQWTGRTTLEAADLNASTAIFSNFALLPYPDLAHIRIRRLQEDGSEKVIDVDLAKAISAAPADITPEAARKSDVVLQGGDVVEIPLKKDAAAWPWKGFAPEEERFFAKVLSGKVQLSDNEGNVSFSEIDYRAPRFIETAAGLLPVPAASGVPSARGWWITHSNNGYVRRAGVAGIGIDISPSFVFLRDGDEYRWGPLPGARLPRPGPAVTPPPVPGSR